MKLSNPKPMNPEWKAKWIAALRSGEYQQIPDELEGDIIDRETSEPCGYGYCCLGVLRKIMGSNLQDGGYLHEDDLKKAGLTDETQKELAWFNDGANYRPQLGFRQIADIIEEEL